MWKAGIVISFYDVVWDSSIHHHLRIAVPLSDRNAVAIKSTSNHRSAPNFSRDWPLRSLATGDTGSAMHPSCGFEWCHIGGIHSRPYTHAGSFICVERILSQVRIYPLAIPLLIFMQCYILLQAWWELTLGGLCRYLYVCAATACTSIGALFYAIISTYCTCIILLRLRQLELKQPKSQSSEKNS